MGKIIFITGSTGLLGSYLLKRLLSQNKDIRQIVALSRGKTQKDAERRVLQALKAQSSSEEIGGDLSLLRVVLGDITEDRLGLPSRTYDSLSKEVTVIYHSAALCDFNIPLPIMRKVNVHGTKNILDFALACQKKGDFDRVHYISTVAVAGDKKGVFYEKELDIGQKFNNTYEKSKFETEKLVGEYRRKALPIAVYRPAIIIGDSKTGYTNNLKMFYQPLHLFSLEFFKEIPGNRDTAYSFVPANCTADAIICISTSNSDDNLTYNIVNPNMVKLSFIVDVASKYFGFRKPQFIPRKEFRFEKISPLQLSLIETFIPYFDYKLRFDGKNSRAILDKTDFKWPKIDAVLLTRLFRFCDQIGFIKTKKRK